MVLIVGGEGSGKRSFALSLGYTPEQIADGVIDNRPVVYHLEQMVFANPDCIDSLLPELVQKAVVICNEVGSGVMPIEWQERAGREATGRLCVRLAQQAECVVRMVSGIPMVIKGQLG